ncbi:hypothetical protein [Paracoccus sp. J56]|uniref:hypothetical protein n=1 Tax=Paracoccus sp. J56 TaxID=935850 RepID=UPI000A0ACEFD|nr:hypothetical protein [Paracoccus sp. J56]SMG32211.1 hypothetical protein SAMN02746000_01861 [Paracoccus sp. J56]
MQHEMMRQPTPAPMPDHIGDVLSSIRKLIDQDTAGSHSPDHPSGPRITRDLAGPTSARIELVSSEPPATAARVTPLVLDVNAMVAPDPEDQAEPPAALPEVHAVMENADQPEMLSDALPEARVTKPERADDLTSDSDTEPPSFDTAAPAAIEMISSSTPDLSLQGPATITEMEEAMLHVSTPATPATPVVEMEDSIASARDSSEPHLFAPRDKGPQNGPQLRGLIREAIRQELQGEIGNRLSRNLQQMIRHEIELALRQMCEQD